MPTDLAGLTYLTFPSGRQPKVALRPAAQALIDDPSRWLGPNVDESVRSRIERLLRVSQAELAEQTKITTGLGLHIYLPDYQVEPPALRRIARSRLGPMTPKLFTEPFTRGTGIVGTCWAKADRVFVNLEEDVYLTVQEAAWYGLDEGVRAGMSYDLLEASRSRYKAVGAVPIVDIDAGFKGCVSFNLGNDAVASPEALDTGAARRVLSNCAEVMAIVLSD